MIKTEPMNFTVKKFSMCISDCAGSVKIKLLSTKMIRRSVPKGRRCTSRELLLGFSKKIIKSGSLGSLVASVQPDEGFVTRRELERRQLSLGGTVKNQYERS